jgi:DNA helicase II / ATP-dependent DNA helicase PcrA
MNTAVISKPKPTVQMQAFFDSLTKSRRHIALVARAGCGKTTSIMLAVDILRKLHPMAEIMVCAYNSAIAKEVKGRLEEAGHTNWKFIQSSTLHSMGFGLLKFLFKPTIDDKKVKNLITRKNDGIYLSYGEQIQKLVAYAKQEGVGFFPNKQIGDVSMWYELADHYDVNGLDDTSEMDLIVEAAQVIYRESLAQTDIIDFDDMILFPLVKNLRVRFGKDFIFLDEAQDLSPARQALAMKFLKQGTGRMILVGDPAQAIYGFSGADADALPNMIKRLDAIQLPLSVTWRCPKAVVRLAQTIVPDIQAADSAIEGYVGEIGALPDDIGPGDAILCRKTAPLIEAAYKLLRQGKACKVEGRNIGEGLQSLTRRWKLKGIAPFMTRLEDYLEREVQKAAAKGKDDKVEEVQDRVATLMQICNECLGKGKTQISDVEAFIDELFADGVEGVITLATYHRSKGREWKRVFLWNHHALHPSKAARQQWQLVQEDNLAYVAFTRAQESLFYVRTAI